MGEATCAFAMFFGRGGDSVTERELDAVRIAIGASVLGRAGEAGFAPLLAVTADAEAAAAFTAAGAHSGPPTTSPFHLGEELRHLARTHRLERVATIGAGAGALLAVDVLAALRAEVEGADALVVSNNHYSADLVAFTPVSALDAIALPAADNPLPRLLHQQAGLPFRQLERSAATLLDVDTPVDAAILGRHPACPADIGALAPLRAWESEIGARVDAIMRIVTTPEVELVVAGRVGAPVWSYLESQTACRVRMLAEERGMQAAGRDVSGAARSALGFLYEAVGPAGFFQRLGDLGDGVLLDSRVLFAHLGWRPTPPDRYASDLFRADAIGDSGVRAFTEAARAAPYPMLLGGHTLVSGALWTLVDAAWAGHP